MKVSSLGGGEVGKLLWRWLENGLSQVECKAIRDGVSEFVEGPCAQGWPLLKKQFKWESELYKPFNRTIQMVRDRFSKVLPGKLKGTAQSVHGVHLKHDMPKLHTSPDIVVLDDECPTCHNPSVPLYCHARSVVDIKLDKRAGVEHDGIQLGLYARQILIQQPDRRFVLTFIMTEKRLRIYGFDRSGGWYTDLVDFAHDSSRYILVLAILVMFWSDEAIGKDPNIVLEGKLSATIHLRDFQVPPLGNVDIDQRRLLRTRKCTLVMKATSWTRHRAVRSRGTTCWFGVIEDDHFTCVLKDYWRAVSRPSEAHMLLQALDLDGVGQLVAYREGERVSDTRGKECLVEGSLFPLTMHVPTDNAFSTDRVRCQVLLEQYSGPLSQAPTPLAFLIAFRDCVAGKSCNKCW